MIRLGTKSNPFIIRVPSEERAAEISAFCDSHHWYAIFEINDEEEEDLEDLDIKLNAPKKSLVMEPKIGRNELCFCGSGKKFKKCCLGAAKIPLTEAVAENTERICAHCEIETFLNDL